MEKVIYNLVFNRKKRLNAEGKALIQVEAYLNRQKKYFSTKIYVKPTQWDSKRKAVRNHPNMDELNQYIEDYITYLERIELDMVQSGRPFSLKYLRERGDFESVSSSFVSFMKNEINHSNLRLSTLKNHLSTLQVLCQYQPQVSFDDLTFNFLCGFEHFLLEQKYHRNTIAKHMKHLKRYVNLAINKDLFELQKYPFRKYKIKYMESKRGHLIDDTTRRALFNDLLEVSAFPGESEILRAIEVTIVVHEDIMPWRYPAKRELQFGEWQRNDILAGIFEPATIDIDLAILLTKAREHSVALVGPAAEELFDPVPEQDLFEALNETLTLWNSPPDWAGDERNVVLTLSRIWYSAATGKIAPKDVAANWAMEHLPAQHQSVLLEARQAYLGQEEDRLASRADQLEEFVHYVKGEITKVVGK